MSNDQVNLAKYIRDMALQLGKMANGESLNFLSYLLYLAVAEADNLINSQSASNTEDSSQPTG
jgi:hypothetical protein